MLDTLQSDPPWGSGRSGGGEGMGREQMAASSVSVPHFAFCSFYAVYKPTSTGSTAWTQQRWGEGGRRLGGFQPRRWETLYVTGPGLGSEQLSQLTGAPAPVSAPDRLSTPSLLSARHPLLVAAPTPGSLHAPSTHPAPRQSTASPCARSGLPYLRPHITHPHITYPPITQHSPPQPCFRWF